MTITIPNALPRLAVGTHNEGSGFACVMNAIAYMNGDKQISDMPDCVWTPFAHMAQHVNDTICNQLTYHCRRQPGQIHENGSVAQACCSTNMTLCGSCSHKVWMFGAQLIGTAELAQSLTAVNRRRAAVEMALLFMDWKREQWALRDPQVMPHIAHLWQSLTHQARRSAEQVIAGQHVPEAALSLFLGTMEEASIRGRGGFMTLELLALAHTHPSKGEEINNRLLQMGNAYNRRGQLSVAEVCGATSLTQKMPELVGILRRAAGHAAQADIVITPEQVAKVPVAVA